MEHYTTFVSEEIQGLMGSDINKNIFNPVPNPVGSQALYYADPSDTQKGVGSTQLMAVVAAGWISSAKELANFVMGAYNGTAFDKDFTETMFREKLGWDMYEGLYGQDFYHGSAFGWERSKGVIYGLTTCIMIFPRRTAALLLINHCVDNEGPFAATELVKACEAQVGLPASK